MGGQRQAPQRHEAGRHHVGRELLGQMRSHVDGTYIMPSFGRYEQSAELVRRVRSELLAVDA